MGSDSNALENDFGLEKRIGKKQFAPTKPKEVPADMRNGYDQRLAYSALISSGQNDYLNKGSNISNVDYAKDILDSYENPYKKGSGNYSQPIQNQSRVIEKSQMNKNQGGQQVYQPNGYPIVSRRAVNENSTHSQTKNNNYSKNREGERSDPSYLKNVHNFFG